MRGVFAMNKREANIAMLSVIPEDEQEKIYAYLSDYCNSNPFKKVSAEEIYAQLAEGRACFERGEYEDFDDALDEICEKYGV